MHMHCIMICIFLQDMKNIVSLTNNESIDIYSIILLELYVIEIIYYINSLAICLFIYYNLYEY